jgi:Outer membrane efflux protein
MDALFFISDKFRLADLAGRELIDLPNVDSETTSANAPAATTGMGLADAVSLSLQQSPQMRQARAQFESAEARVGVARADLLPAASIHIAKGPEKSESTTQAIPTTGTNKHTYFSRTMRLTQPVFNVPVFKEFDSSHQTKDASALRLQSMREATSLAATKATIDMAVARITLNFSDAQLEQLKKILNYLEARASAGASSQADLERARTRVLNARQTRIEQQTNYRNAMFELDRLTGVMPTTLQLPFLQLLPALPDNHGQIRQDGSVCAQRAHVECSGPSAHVTGPLARVAAVYASVGPFPYLSVSINDTTEQTLHRPSTRIEGHIAIHQVAHNFANGSVALRELNLKITPGERVALHNIAPNDRFSWLGFKPQEAPLMAGTLEQDLNAGALSLDHAI